MCNQSGEVLLYLPTITPAVWKLRSHTGSRLQANFSRLIEKINVSCCCLAWHNLQKYVNSDPCKERKPCEKWINDNTFLTVSDFWSEKQVKTLPSEDFGRLWKSSEDFEFGNLRKWSCHLQKSQHSQDKNLTLISQKKLAGISYQQLLHNCPESTPCWGVLPGCFKSWSYLRPKVSSPTFRPKGGYKM